MRARAKLDVRGGGDAIDEVLRHARRESRAAHEHPDFLRVRREKDRRLSRGIAAADEHDLLARAHLRLDGRGPVPDAVAFQRHEVAALRGPPISRARRDDDGARTHRAAVAELELHRRPGIRRIAMQALDLHRNQHARAELLRLVVAAAGERLARDAGGEAEIILDARARAGLPPEGARVDDEY